MLQTDPKRLRDEGAKLFLQFLRPEDRIAIMQFDKEAKLLRPLSTFTPEIASAVAADISKVSAQGVYTDILAGVQAAGELLKKEKRHDAGGIILMLSDGKMEPDPAIGQAYPRIEQLLNNELPALRAAGVKLHTLALSELSDRKLLSELATSTDGVSTFAPTAEAIHEAFANLFLAVKKPQVLPLTSKGFSIDSDVREATFYVNREPDGQVILVSPTGKEYSADSVDESIKWFRGGSFDVITLSSPQHGDWMLRGMIAKDGFATVLTNLKLVSDWPSTITARDPTLLQARLNEGEKPVVLREMSGNTRYALQIIPTDKVSEPVIEDVLFDDGTHGDKIAGDGIFSYRVTLPEPGDYKMWIVAKGPTFDRRQQIPFRVKPPLIAVQIIASEHRAEDVSPEDPHQKDAHSPEGDGGGSQHQDGKKHETGPRESSSTHENQGEVFRGRPGDRVVVEL
ncbi:MAG: VWA domain-containing protein, partial [Proteobacteria bacterium]|nr:VWA domain-containing protein [Pseudomonadota bacterium]